MIPRSLLLSLEILLLTIIRNAISHAFIIQASVEPSPQPNSQYYAERSSILLTEQQLAIGGQLVLSAKERLVDGYLKGRKRSEVEAGLQAPAQYAPALHFFIARPLIERSAVFELLRQMPKGASLHGHNTAMVSTAWIVQNLTYLPGLQQRWLKPIWRTKSSESYADANVGLQWCDTLDGNLVLSFRRADWHKCATDYVSVADARNQAPDVQEFDSLLEQKLTLFTERPQTAYPDINTVWRRFNAIFHAVSDIVSYEHTYRTVFRRLLQEMYDDNVMYLEIRTGFTQTYYDDNRITTEMDLIRDWQAIIAEFRRNNPHFLGAKFIYSKSRNTDEVDELMRKYRQLKAEFPDLIVGFDLVGQEDVGKPLITFADKLLANMDIDYMFHAGETDWSDYGSDRNLLDAILLNATRIGHGYSLFKHPVLLDRVRRHRICLEVCPISNQVLGLIRDMRNHPGTVYSALNVPMVIASDDPGFWGASGLSYDFYYALMSFTGVETGLTYVKQLVLNSLRFSRLNLTERNDASAIFNRQWDTFLDTIISSQSLSVDPIENWKP